MRGFAALTVCIGHSWHESQALVRDIPTSVSNFYFDLPVHYGVDLFFLISGFIMMHTAQHLFGQRREIKMFLLRRLIRIVPLYWLFTGLMIAATLIVPSLLQKAEFSWSHAMLSLLFIPHTAPNGSISPILSLGWTLNYEMFFYALFACALLWRRAAYGIGFMLIVFLGLLALTPHMGFVGQQFFGHTILFCFVLGCLLYYRQLHLPLALIAAGVWFLWAEHIPHIISHGVPALYLYLGIFYLYPKVQKWLGRFGEGLVLLGNASYALYLSHPFTLEVIKQVFKISNLSSAALYIPIAVIASCLASVLVYRLFEVPVTRSLRRKLG